MPAPLSVKFARRSTDELELLPQHDGVPGIAEALTVTVALEEVAFPSALEVCAVTSLGSLQLATEWSSDSNPSPALFAFELRCVEKSCSVSVGATPPEGPTTCVLSCDQSSVTELTATLTGPRHRIGRNTRNQPCQGSYASHGPLRAVFNESFSCREAANGLSSDTRAQSRIRPNIDLLKIDNRSSISMASLKVRFNLLSAAQEWDTMQIVAGWLPKRPLSTPTQKTADAEFVLARKCLKEVSP